MQSTWIDRKRQFSLVCEMKQKVQKFFVLKEELLDYEMSRTFKERGNIVFNIYIYIYIAEP